MFTMEMYNYLVNVFADYNMHKMKKVSKTTVREYYENINKFQTPILEEMNRLMRESNKHYRNRPPQDGAAKGPGQCRD